MDKQQIIILLKSYLQKPGFLNLVSVDEDAWSYNFKRDIATIRKWKVEHEKEYVHFKAGVMHASYGDYSSYMQIFKTAVSCIPQTILHEISSIIAGKQNHSESSEFDSCITALLQFQGFIEYNKVELDCDIDINVQDLHIDFVRNKGDEDKFFYVRIPSSLEFFYSLPWDWQCAIRTLSSDTSDIELATMARRLYMKICFSHSEIRHNIEELGKNKDSFTMCLLYFIVFDHGLKTAYNALVRSFALDQNLGIFTRTVIPTLKHLIATSIENGQDSKRSWIMEIDDNIKNYDLRNDMHILVDNTKGISGRPRTATNILSLEDLIIDHVPATLELIKEFRKQYPKPVGLAYLFYILKNAGCTNESFYSVFHHSMEAFEGRKYNLRNPQDVYNNFPINKEFLIKKGTPYQKKIYKKLRCWIVKFQILRMSA